MLKFEEHDLAYQLDLEDLKNRKNKRKGDAFLLAMRRRLKLSVNESIKKNRGALGGQPPGKEHIHYEITAQNVKQIVKSTSLDVKKQTQVPYEAPIRMYPLNKVRYNGD